MLLKFLKSNTCKQIRRTHILKIDFISPDYAILVEVENSRRNADHVPSQKDGQELGPVTRDLRAWDPRVFEMLQQCFRT